MKKEALFLLFVFGSAVFGFGQEIQIKDQTPFVYAYLECSGSYSQISAKIGEFMGAYFGQGLNPPGALFCLYSNSPSEVSEAELKWQIGMPIGKDVSPAAPLKKGEFAYSKVATYHYVGPYEKVSEVYAKIMAYLEKNGWKVIGPAMEMYLNNPQEVAPEKLETDIILPVGKK